MTSSDGRYAALVKFKTVHIVYLATGAQHAVDINLPNDQLGPSSADLTAFTPEGRYLLVATKNGVLPIDTATGEELDMLPIPPVEALAIRSRQ